MNSRQTQGSDTPWMDIVEMAKPIEATPHADPCCCPVLVVLAPFTRVDEQD